MERKTDSYKETVKLGYIKLYNRKNPKILSWKEYNYYKNNGYKISQVNDSLGEELPNIYNLSRSKNRY